MDNLKSAGLKRTQPRVLILTLLEQSEQRHLSPSDIYKQLEQQGNRLGYGSIYRILDKFEEAKLVMCHRFSDGKAIYELCDINHHDHMVDMASGKIVEFSDEIIEQREKEIAKKYGFKLLERRLVMYGTFKDKH